MMSILIMGMEKPKKCCAMVGGECVMCPFVNDDDECVVLLQMQKRVFGTWEDQYAQCPLVELPESHGRLVDADELIADMINGIRAGNLEEGYERYQNINNVDDCVNCVRYADTVIEAEGEG